MKRQLNKQLAKYTRNVLVEKLLKDYELKSEDVVETVEMYYDCQKLRMMHANKERSEPQSPPDPDDDLAPDNIDPDDPENLEKLRLVPWFAYWLQMGEQVMATKLKEWVIGPTSPDEAKWAISQIGIGPIIAAGLAAHIDPEKARSISSVWKFAGLAPGFDRKIKGKKLQYNARLKCLCWKLGESFVKVSGKDGAVYGKLYSQFKSDEVSRNENGQYSRQAKEELSRKTFAKDNTTKKCLLEGKLANAHLHSRAKRRAVKIFLSHYWTVARETRGLPVRKPYAIAVLNHDGEIEANREEDDQNM